MHTSEHLQQALEGVPDVRQLRRQVVLSHCVHAQEHLQQHGHQLLKQVVWSHCVHVQEHLREVLVAGEGEANVRQLLGHAVQTSWYLVRAILTSQPSRPLL